MSDEANTGGVMSREKLYARVAQYAPKAIEVLQELMAEKYQPSVRMGAAKVLLAKAIPDLKAMEIAGKDGNPMQILVVPSDLIDKYQIKADESTIQSSHDPEGSSQG